jgi:nucleolin
MLSLKADYKRAKQEHLAAPADAVLKKAYKAAKKAYKATSSSTSSSSSSSSSTSGSGPDGSHKRKTRDEEGNGGGDTTTSFRGRAVPIAKKRAKTACARCFVGNLPFAITEVKLVEHFRKAGAAVADVFWVTDKQTQKFYGSSFVTFETPTGAQNAIAKPGKILGRPIRVELCPAKITGPSTLRDRKKNAMKTQQPVRTELSEKPDGCRTVYLGNLNYHIDDDKCREFFKADGEIVKFRWLTHKDTGNFKGAGYAEFAEEAGVDRAVLRNGTIFMGRPVRIDYAESRSTGPVY